MIEIVLIGLPIIGAMTGRVITIVISMIVGIVGCGMYEGDELSRACVMLTGILIPLSIIGIWKEGREYMRWTMILEGILMWAFTTRDMIGFYIGYEAAVIPVYMMIVRYGTRRRKIRAGNMIMIYTIIGGIPLIITFIWIYIKTGTTNYDVAMEKIEGNRIIWWMLIIGFGVKVPMVPVHLWLCEAHVEAPTIGSMLLAGLLLKLGLYGMIRYNMRMEEEMVRNRGIVYVIGGIGIVYTGLTAMRQTDMKRIIAYGSIGHMSLVVMGIMSSTREGYVGGIIQIVSHGIVSGGLFYGIGVIYEQTGSRLVRDYSGLWITMPIWSVMMMVLIMGNIGLPGTGGFVGEIMIIAGLIRENVVVGVIGALGMVINAVYTLWMYNRIVFGNAVRGMKEMNRRECGVIIPISVITIIIGIMPWIIIG